MSNSDKSDDDWAELARELERDKPSAPNPPSARAHETDFELVEDEETPEGLAGDESASDEFEDAGEGGAESETEGGEEPGTGDGTPGTGRKRRRRRRRRRKGGPGQAAEAGASEDGPAEKAGAEPDGENEDTGEIAAETEGEAPPIEEDFDQEGAEEEIEDSPVRSAAEAEEDAGGELLRELIANWNVPSWDDVVTGLYRPER